MTNDYRLLAVDIDGTLTRTDGTISPRTIKVIHDLQSQGMRLCISSGRPPQGIMPIARLLGMDEFGGNIIAFNGALLVDYASGTELYKASLPDEAIPVVLEYGRREEYAVLTYACGEIYTNKPENPYVQISHHRNGMPLHEVKDFMTEVPLPVPKCLIAGEPYMMPELQREVASRLKGIADAYISDAFFMEVVRTGVDKSNAIARLMEQLSFTNSQLITAGDGHNDMGMIRMAAMGIAMSNAHADVQSVANIVAPHTDEDGLAQVLESLL